MIPYTQIRIYEDIGSEFVYDQELCDAINVEHTVDFIIYKSTVCF